MRDNALTLAIVALLALGASGVTAASMDAPDAETPSATELPVNHTVDVVNPDAVNDEEVQQAIETAWANNSVQSYFDAGTAIHFEIWASELDDGIIHVKVAPQNVPNDTRVIADIDLDQQKVASVDEPVTLDASNSIAIDASDYDIVSADGDERELDHEDTNSDENATRYTADQAFQIRLIGSSMERDGGTLSVQSKDGDGMASNGTTEDTVQTDV